MTSDLDPVVYFQWSDSPALLSLPLTNLIQSTSQCCQGHSISTKATIPAAE